MDIPLPGEPDPGLAKISGRKVMVQSSLTHDIPLPSPRSAQPPTVSTKGKSNLLPTSLPPGMRDADDTNRYSPSHLEDDQGKEDQMEQTPQQEGSLIRSPFLSKGIRTTVLGKAQAKKRLLAFSMTKQGGGQGLSFGFNKKTTNKMSASTSKTFAGPSTQDDHRETREKNENPVSPKRVSKRKLTSKKVATRDEKSRAVVSAIEEIKREEMLMRGVLGYGPHIGNLVDVPVAVPLVTPPILPPAKPKDELQMSNLLSERKKGEIESLLDSLLTHDSDKKAKEEAEREKKKNDERRKRESEKSSHHSKERRRSKEHQSRSGHEHVKEEKKHRPSDLPKNWQQFRERGFKLDEIRRLKLKLEKDKSGPTNRDRSHKSRDREHRSRSKEKKHKSPSSGEEKDKMHESNYDIMSRPFESTPKFIYPFVAVGIHVLQKSYPRSLIRFTKNQPSIPYCENPQTSKAHYRTRDEIISEASPRVAELMLRLINGEQVKSHVKSEKNYKPKQVTDTNLSSSLAALQVSYDETEIDENMSSSDDTSGNRRERLWFPQCVIWPDGEDVRDNVSSEKDVSVKKEKSDEDVESYKKRENSEEESAGKENDLPNFINSEKERDVKISEGGDNNASARTTERTTVRSKWDSDYEDEKANEDSNIHSVHESLPDSHPNDEKWKIQPSDEKWKTPPSDGKWKSPPSDEKWKTPPSDEKWKSQPNDEKWKSQPIDEKWKSSPNDEKWKSPPNDEKWKSPPNDEKWKSPPNDEKWKSPPNDEKWKKTENGKEFEHTSKECEKDSASESEESSDSTSSESASVHESNTEDSVSASKESHTPSAPEKKETNHLRTIIDEEKTHDEAETAKHTFAVEENSNANVPVDHSNENNADLKLASEYEEFMKAVSFDASVMENENSEVSHSDVGNAAPANDHAKSSTHGKRVQRNSGEAPDSEASHDRLDIEPANVEEAQRLKKLSETKVVPKPKLMTSSASEDELTVSKNEKVVPKVRLLDDDNLNSVPTKKERNNKSSSSESSSSSASSADSEEEVKEKRKGKSKKVAKKKRKKIMNVKKKRKKSSKKKQVESSSSSDSDSSSDKDSSSSSDSEDNCKRRGKHSKEKAKKRAKSSSSDDSDDSSSEDQSSDDKASRKKKNKKKKRSKKVLKKKVSKKKKHKRKDSDSSDSEDYVKEKHSKTSRRKSNSQKELSGNKVSEDHPSDRGKNLDLADSNNSDAAETNIEQNKKQSKKHREIDSNENSQRKDNKRVNSREDYSSVEESGDGKHKRKDSKKKSSKSYKKTTNYASSESSDDESGRRRIKKRRRDRRSRTISPVVSSNKKRRRSPSTSPEHSPTPQRRNSTEGKSRNRGEESKEQSSSNRKLKQGTGSSKRGNKQKDLEASELDDSSSEESSSSKSEKSKYRSSTINRVDDWEVNSEHDNSDDATSSDSDERVNNDNDDDEDEVFLEKTARRKGSGEENLGKLLRSEDIKKEIFSEEEEEENTKEMNSFFERYKDTYAEDFSLAKVKVEPREDNLNVRELYKPHIKEVVNHRYQSDKEDSNSKGLISKAQPIIKKFPLVSLESGSDMSLDSFKETVEIAAPTTSLKIKKIPVNASEENSEHCSSLDSASRDSYITGKGTNFSLDNIPLPPPPKCRERIFSTSQDPVGLKITPTNESNTLIVHEKGLNPPPTESLNLEGITLNPPGMQRHVVSFKLLSQSSRLQPSIVDSSEVQSESSPSKQQPHTTQILKNRSRDSIISRMESDSERENETSIAHKPREMWNKEYDSLDTTPLQTTESNASEVSSSTSKVVLDTETCEKSLNIQSFSKDRPRKRPSRWGMTTVPPKRKLSEDNCEPVIAVGKSDSNSLSPNVMNFFEKYVTTNIRGGDQGDMVKDIFQYSALGIAEKGSKELSSKKLPDRLEGKEVPEEQSRSNKWNIDELDVEMRGERWKGRTKVLNHRNEYPRDEWEDDHGKEENIYLEKMHKGVEECGQVIDWENDLEQPKETKDTFATTKEETLYDYSCETSESKSKRHEWNIREVRPSAQDDSESEWESRETHFQTRSLPSPFRPRDTKGDAEERQSNREKQDSHSEKLSQRNSSPERESCQRDNRRWRDHDIEIGKKDDKRVKEDFANDTRMEEEQNRQTFEKRGRRGEEAGRKDESPPTREDRQESRTRDSFRDDYPDNEKVVRNRRGDKLGLEEEEDRKGSEDRESCSSREKQGRHRDQLDIRGRKDSTERKASRERDRRSLENQESRRDDDRDRKEYIGNERSVEEDEDQWSNEGHNRKGYSEREKQTTEGADPCRDEERSRKDYSEQKKNSGRERERREGEMHGTRRDDEQSRKDYGDRNSTRDRERRESRDRRDDRRRDRDRDRRSERRERWDREKRDRHREERDCNRSRSPVEFHNQREEQREQSRSPQYWRGDWNRGKDRDCDCASDYYVADIPLPINTIAPGSSVWPSRAPGETEMELSCSPTSSPLVGFKRSVADSTISDSELVASKQEEHHTHHTQEMSPSSTVYTQGSSSNKPYDRKPPPFFKQPIVNSSPLLEGHPSPINSPAFSPKRLSLDDRIEIELGVKKEALGPPPTQQYQLYHQQSAYPYTQYFANLPPPNQFDTINEKYLSVPPPNFNQPPEEFSQLQLSYPPPVKPPLNQMPPPPIEAPLPKRRPGLLPTPTNIRPCMANWDSPEAFIGAQPPLSPRYTTQPPQSSRVVQVGNVLQVVPADGPPPPPPPQSIVLQTGNVLQVIPGSATSAAPRLAAPVKPLFSVPPPTHVPPPHALPTHIPPPNHPPPHVPPPVHMPPMHVPPPQPIPLLKSPSLDMSPSPAITSPIPSVHPPTSTLAQVATSTTSSPVQAPVVSLATNPVTLVPTPVAAPQVSYSPPASPFLVAPMAHTPVVAMPEGAPVMPSQGDCPIPFLSSVELAQASQIEDTERRRAERARRRQEREKRRKEKEKRHQNKLKHSAERIIKKALEKEEEMLGGTSDIDLEEMRLIEEAMQQVPEPEEEEEEEEETPQAASSPHSRKKRKTSIEVTPLPPAGKGILVSPGFREKPLGSSGIERKSVKFADGIRPGEGTSPSAGEDLPSPPPPPRKLPKEKRYKKKKKKKIKVKIIRQINVEDEDDDDEDISPPPPPPGSPPPPPIYPPGTHYPPTYPPAGYTFSTAPPFTVLPGVDTSTTSTAGTSGNVFTPLYHQHHHTTTTTHTTTVQFAPPPPPATPVPPPPANAHLFKRESKTNP